jgi:LacI family transcriptional regulator
MACGYTEKNAYDVTRLILKQKEKPTAFLAQDDNMALGVREAAFESGFRIPEDIALVGFNNISLSSLTGIELTTVDQDQHAMGMTAAEMLIHKLQQSDRPGISNAVVMETKLVIRKSCGYYLHRQVQAG